jgi:putative FmdB family regulatory protein
VPKYEYRCTQCDHTFDVYQAFSDSALTECPECGGALRKVFGSLGVTFQGSGFYRNDSRQSAQSNSSSGSESSGSKSGASSGSSSSD